MCKSWLTATETEDNYNHDYMTVVWKKWKVLTIKASSISDFVSIFSRLAENLLYFQYFTLFGYIQTVSYNAPRAYQPRATVLIRLRSVSHSNGQPGLRSSDTAAYVKPTCRTQLGERGFSYAGPTAWNSLPAHLHQISDTSLFKRRLKTELFRRAYRR